MTKKKTYWQNIGEGITTLLGGMKLAFRHIWQARNSRKPIGIENSGYFDQQTGIATLQYPHETIPIPDNGRYRLHNEIDDCIVCDLCAKICPVNCIEIEAIRSTEEIGKTSDGSTKRLYAGKFDIDMAKCCYCGLCTTVCPTECLTMTKSYDYSEFDVRNMVYHFSDISPEQAEKQKEIFEESQRIKAELKAKEKIDKHTGNTEATALTDRKKSGPIVISAKKQSQESSSEEEKKEATAKPAPKFIPRPVIKAKPTSSKEEKSGEEKKEETVSKKPGPVIPALKKTEPAAEAESPDKKGKPAPNFIPRPVIPKKTSDTGISGNEEKKEETPKKKPGPVIPPIQKADASAEKDSAEEKKDEVIKKPAPKFIPKPVIPKKPKQNPDNES